GPDRRTVRVLRTKERARVQGADVAKVEVLVNLTVGAGLQVLLECSRRRQPEPTLFQAGHSLVVRGGGFLEVKFFGVKKIGFVFLGVNVRDDERATDRAAEILTTIERSLVPKCLTGGLTGGRRDGVDNVEVVARVERFVANKVVEVTVPVGSSRLGGYLDRTGCGAAVLSAVVGG